MNKITYTIYVYNNTIVYCLYPYIFQSNNKSDFNNSKRRKDNLVQKIIGSGIHKKIILATSLSKDIRYSEGLSYAIPQPTLEFGYLCLKNALLLLPNNNEPNVSVPAMTNSVSLSLTSGHNLGIDYNLYDITHAQLLSIYSYIF